MTVHKDMLWKCIEEFKIHKKLIKMCKSCVRTTRSTVRTEGTLSSSFENKAGLEQGDSLSTILFNLTLQKVIQSIKMVPSSINIGKEQLNLLAYADDMLLSGKMK